MKLPVRIYGMVALWAVLLSGIDQGIKGLVTVALAPDKSRVIIPDVMHLVYRENTGTAFSLLQQLPPYALLAINIVVLALFLYLIRPYLAARMGRVATALVLGGALGNMIDRAARMRVIDYLDIRLTPTYHWPVFNLADCAVVTGIGLLAWLFLRSEYARTPHTGGHPA